MGGWKTQWGRHRKVEMWQSSDPETRQNSAADAKRSAAHTTLLAGGNSSRTGSSRGRGRASALKRAKNFQIFGT